MDINNLTDHEKAMIEKANSTGSTANVDGQITPPVKTEGAPAAGTTTTEGKPEGEQNDNQAQRPEWCPEEFWNAETGVADTEKLAKSYADLKNPKPAEGEAAKEGKEGEGKEGEGDEGEKKDPPFVAAVEAANADLLKDGKLADETYKGFEKLGLSREHVDAYIEGQQAKAELIKMRVFGEAGSEEAFTAMFQWGVTNYTEAERAMFDQMMNSGDAEKALSATRALAARHAAAEGKQGNIVTPQSQSNASPTGYTTKDEVVAAMAKPEYRTNAKYRAEVGAKIEAALKAGTDLGF